MARSITKLLCSRILSTRVTQREHHCSRLAGNVNDEIRSNVTWQPDTLNMLARQIRRRGQTWTEASIAQVKAA